MRSSSRHWSGVSQYVPLWWKHVLSLDAAPLADHTPDPTSVAVVGSVQSEASGGACGDWDPGCAGAFAA